MPTKLLAFLLCLTLAACSSNHQVPTSPRAPLTIGDSFTLDSQVLAEPRHINVFTPTAYGQKFDGPLPVLYMPDGGMDEDFLHIAGLMQVLVSNGTMRPFILVGIQNTVRRRDMTGPTTNPEDLKIAPVVGGSAKFRRFIKEELMPTVRSRYRTTDETAIIGESLAGLFVVETYFLEPDLFSTYIALDPSIWWNNEELAKASDSRLKTPPTTHKTVLLSNSNEPDLARLTAQLAASFESHRTSTIDFHYKPLPAESHATIYHPAALIAFRTVFAPPPEK